MTPARDIARLIEIMAALRTPGSGCPWDLEQSLATIAPYTLEEAYEVADAIARNNLDDLREELGDLLLQVVFHARMAQELGAFDFGDVVQALTEKLIRRHPHVFGDARDLTPEAVKGLWERIKSEERAARKANGRDRAPDGALAGVPVTLPALTRALKLQAKAGKVGFDWNDARAVLKKIREEADEIEADLKSGHGAGAAAEVGDLLFAAVNLARHLDADPEGVLRATNQKFERRFATIERVLAAAGKTPQDATLDEMDDLWNAAKADEKATSGWKFWGTDRRPTEAPGADADAQADAVALLSELVQSPKLLAKSIVRVAVKGRRKADDYWRRRIAWRTEGPNSRRRFEPAPGMALYGFFKTATGIGQAARSAAIGLRSVGYPISCHEVRSQVPHTIPFDSESSYVSGFDTTLLWTTPEQLLHDERLLHLEAIAARHRIAQWVWELPVFPAVWAKACDYVDEIWTPSTYAAASLALITEKPVRLVPHAVDVPPIDPAAARLALGIRDDEVLFSSVFDARSYIARKNPLAVVRAFLDAFPDRDARGPRLIVKWIEDAHTADQLRDVEILVQNDPRVILRGQMLSRDEICQIHAACDVYVSLHRAEGFGLNIAEAMAMGKLAIVTNFSGSTDFANADNALLIDFAMRRVLANEYPFGAGQWWAEPDHDAAVAAMRTAYRDAGLRRRLGERARRDITANLSPAAIGRRMMELRGGPIK